MDLDYHKREDAAFAAYFSHIIGELPEVTGVTAVCIAHMVSNSRHFLPAVDAMAPVGLVLPKPNSKTPKVFGEIQHRGFRTDELSRDWARNAERVVDTFQRHNLSKKRLVIIDIGGYFASSIGHVAKLFDGEIRRCFASRARHTNCHSRQQGPSEGGGSSTRVQNVSPG